PAMSDTATGMMEQGAANEVNTLGRLEGDQLNALLGQPPHVHNEVPLPSMRGKAREDTRKRGRTCRSLAPHLRRCCRDWSRNKVYPGSDLWRRRVASPDHACPSKRPAWSRRPRSRPPNGCAFPLIPAS